MGACQSSFTWALAVFDAVTQAFSLRKLSRILLKGNKIGWLTIVSGLGTGACQNSVFMFGNRTHKRLFGLEVKPVKRLSLFHSLLQTFRFLTARRAAQRSERLDALGGVQGAKFVVRCLCSSKERCFTARGEKAKPVFAVPLPAEYCAVVQL